MKQAVSNTINSSLQKAGGVAALIAAAAFLAAIVFMLTAIAPSGYGSLDISAVQNATFLAGNQTILYLWNLISYVVFGIVLVVLALALYDRLKDRSSATVQAATAFGLIWAGLMFASGMVANIGAGVVVDVYSQDPSQAGAVWLALHFVVDGLGGGNEIVGGLWVLLLSWAGLRSGGLPRLLAYLGLLIGAAGFVTVIPALGDVGALFGLGSIAWFVWVGIALLRSNPGAAAAKADVMAPRHSAAA